MVEKNISIKTSITHKRQKIAYEYLAQKCLFRLNPLFVHERSMASDEKFDRQIRKTTFFHIFIINGNFLYECGQQI